MNNLTTGDEDRPERVFNYQIAGAIFVLALLLSQCTPDVPPSDLPTAELARLHCGNCHQFPEPAMLDKATWRDAVLPKMKFMLGFRQMAPDSILEQFSEGPLGTQMVDDARLFPQSPVLAEADWQRLRDWYLEKAPSQLPKARYTQPPDLDLPFTTRYPRERFSPPGTTLVQFLEPDKLMTADVQKNRILQWDQDLQIAKQAPLPSGAVHLNDEPNGLWFTAIGSFIASDQAEGFLIHYPKAAQEAAKIPLPPLRRPVHAAFGDLNQDGRSDIVVCEYGKWLGQLAWWEQGANGLYTPHPLRSTPGAVKTKIVDLNRDGLPDVVALFAQAREGVSVFYNQGGGAFREKNLLKFPPTYGSTSFDLIDFDFDGNLDILYTAGDNADYHPVLKPYHGVYLFRNDGHNQFEQAFFYHLPGAYGARAADFDQDGDLDLAAVAYFPDYGNPGSPGFVYLQRQDSLRFTPHVLADDRQGRWLSLDVGDFDADGDQDIVLASLAMEIADQRHRAQQERWLAEGIPFVLLENEKTAD